MNTKDTNNSASFFSHLFPQSVYRKYQAEKEHFNQKRQALNTQLPEINITNTKHKEELVNRLVQLSQQVTTVLLTKKDQDEVLNDGHLDKIRELLGI